MPSMDPHIMMLRHTRLTTLLIACVALAAPASAKVIQEQRWIDARVTDASGGEVAQKIMVTIFHDDAASKPYPALVLNHGRASEAKDRRALGRAQYTIASTWFAERGFMVAVPTRIGYGVSSGPDVENNGSCNKKNYPPGYAASAAQTLTVLAYLRGWKEVAKDRAVVVGQSYGGATAVAIAAANTPGVQATINFAGGGGGNPKTMPEQPCGQTKLKQLFADYGKTARIPTLWIYAENDRYFGPTLPKTWFDAFKAAGGRGEFKMYPRLGEDGHGMFVRAPEWWQPKVLEFLRANGYADIK
ncbi:MAG: dienelactone hydrolase family protein [Burkholderiales bacterium]|nr:dienelactone hydrolase family protein [Burkholderiales bacterium]